MNLKLTTSIKVSIYSAVLEWLVLVSGVLGKLPSLAGKHLPPALTGDQVVPKKAKYYGKGVWLWLRLWGGRDFPLFWGVEMRAAA